jgi:hypothetical protein
MSARTNGFLIAPSSTKSTGRHEQAFQGFGEAEELVQGGQTALRFESDEKVCIAGGGIEVRAASGRAKHFQLSHAIAAAQQGDLGAMLVNQVVHDIPRGDWQTEFTIAHWPSHFSWSTLSGNQSL